MARTTTWKPSSRGKSRPLGDPHGLLGVPDTVALTTTGRRTGRTHRVIVGDLEDGPNIIRMAMNGWGEGEPAWWLNLQASPETRVELADGYREIRARAAQGAERARLWAAWRQLDPNLDAYATRRLSETTIVVLEPLDAGTMAHSST